MADKDYCCDAFKEAAKEQFEPDADGVTWHVNGCCGGCYVVDDMRFCPFCGTQLGHPSAHDKPA